MVNYLIRCAALGILLIAGQAHGYTIMVFGDSLSTAYGFPVEKGWVSLLGDRLKPKDIRVVNKSISGETSYGGLERISQGLAETDPDILILALGANDALRGKQVSTLRQNLARMIQSAEENGAEVLLLGMQMPPNYGQSYADAFQQTYTDLAREFDVAIVPSLLEPIATDFDLFLPDGIHPTAEAQPMLLDHIWPVLSPMLPE